MALRGGGVPLPDTPGSGHVYSRISSDFWTVVMSSKHGRAPGGGIRPFRSAEAVVAEGGRPDGDAAAEEGSAPSRRPNLTGDLDLLLEARPSFRVAVRGYDRLQVDNYVSWAENELAAVRSQCDHLLSRYGACSAQLEISTRLLAQSPRGRELSAVSERVGEILRLAADEATELTAAGAEEADRILAEARTKADARLREAHEIKETAVAAGDELREQARRDAEEFRSGAAAERDRLDAEAAQQREQAAAAMAARLAAAQKEVDGLCGQRDQVRESLRRLTDQLGRALQAVGVTVPDETAGMADRPEPVSS
jgi:cell division septum initiation protein DivIVA